MRTRLSRTQCLGAAAHYRGHRREQTFTTTLVPPHVLCSRRTRPGRPRVAGDRGTLTSRKSRRSTCRRGEAPSGPTRARDRRIRAPRRASVSSHGSSICAPTRGGSGLGREWRPYMTPEFLPSRDKPQPVVLSPGRSPAIGEWRRSGHCGRDRRSARRHRPPRPLLRAGPRPVRGSER
jgi:hypothetical protein